MDTCGVPSPSHPEVKCVLAEGHYMHTYHQGAWQGREIFWRDTNEVDATSELLHAGEAWAAAAEYADRLEETRRIKLAELKLDCKEHSDVAKETWALAQASYRDHVDEMVRARYAERKARVAYLVAQLHAGVSVKGE